MKPTGTRHIELVERRLVSEEAVRQQDGSWMVKPYGFLEGLEIAFPEPVPNMNASAPWVVTIELSNSRSAAPVFAVTALVCSVGNDRKPVNPRP